MFRVFFVVFLISASQLNCGVAPPFNNDQLSVEPFKFSRSHGCDEGYKVECPGLLEPRILWVGVGVVGFEETVLNLRLQQLEAVDRHASVKFLYGNAYTNLTLTSESAGTVSLLSSHAKCCSIFPNTVQVEISPEQFSLKKYLAVLDDKYFFVKIVVSKRYWESFELSCGYARDYKSRDWSQDEVLRTAQV